MIFSDFNASLRAFRAESIISVKVRISKCPHRSGGLRKVHCTLSVDFRETESVFRIDCVRSLRYFVVPALLNEVSVSFTSSRSFTFRKRIVDIRHPERCFDGFGRATLPMASHVAPVPSACGKPNIVLT